MAIKEILIWPDSRLMQKSLPVDPKEDLKELKKDLEDTLQWVGGLGLAAIQIGVAKRVMAFKKNNVIFVVANPEFIYRAESVEFNGEGCLSLPGESFNTTRFNEVGLRHYPIEELNCFYDVDLKEMEAIEVQHEMDHLDGKLLVNGPWCGDVRRDIIRRRMIKYKRMIKRDKE